MHKSQTVQSGLTCCWKLLSIGIILIFISGLALGQKLLPDTIYVNFYADSMIQLNHLSIIDAIDKRNEDPRFVRYGSKRKFLLIPVDQEIYTPHPLINEILNGIPKDTSAERLFIIELEKFVIEKERGRLTSSSALVADIPVYEKMGDTTLWRGTLYYDYPYAPEAKKESLVQSTENLLRKWHTDFKLDLLSLKSDQGSGIPMHSNLVTNPQVKSIYLNSGIAFFYGYNWWGLQGDAYFARPESSSRNHYVAGIVRYQNNPDYEALSFGRRAEHYFYRRNNMWALDIDLNLLLGILKWKNVDLDNPTLYQIFDFELSSTQSFVYNPLNEKGLLIRFGVIENLSYVIGKRLKFYAGGLIGIGVKL
jgi:hypothetical protein